MSQSKQQRLRVGLAVLAAAGLIYGLVSGQAQAVWQKAVFICMECIGIG